MMKIICPWVLILLLAGCSELPWNDPYPYEDPVGNTLYSAFSERPKHLDPAKSYSSTEWPLLCQIVEPPVEYHYLKRPYVLQPLTAVRLPSVKYYNHLDQEIDENTSDDILYSIYEIQIKPGIYFEQHPAFVKNAEGVLIYHDMPYAQAKRYRSIAEFKEKATKELTAEDYVYQIKRLAEPHLHSPIYGIMSRNIEGLSELRKALQKSETGGSNVEQDLRPYVLSGVTLVDRYTYRIRIKGHYPQFIFWLAMPFFSPVPFEVAHFFAQPAFVHHNLSLDWYPVGTGPYTLKDNNPDRRMVLSKNTQYRKPTASMVDKVIYTLEKESVPYWNKFLQGYYDSAGILSDNFASAIRFNQIGEAELTDSMKKKGIQLKLSVSPQVFYWGFNMLDNTVGGYTEKARSVRRAISMAFDVQEYIDIFLNGRGIEAYGPIPPDIFGFDTQKRLPTKNSLLAKALLKTAGYPNGLTVYFDTVASGNPDEIEIHQWIVKQLNKIEVKVVFRTTDYNRFQEKVRAGVTQIFFWGWNADYPDPENFLFLLYSPNGSVIGGGENTSNYNNPHYDDLFQKMRGLKDGPERLKIIKEMVGILQKDSPWIWGFYPKTFALYHEWMQGVKPSGLINNTLQYVSLNPELRAQQRVLWNQPVLWPLWLFGALLGMILFFTRRLFKCGAIWFIAFCTQFRF